MSPFQLLVSLNAIAVFLESIDFSFAFLQAFVCVWETDEAIILAYLEHPRKQLVNKICSSSVGCRMQWQ